MFAWLRRFFNGTSKTATQSESLGKPEMDDQVGQKVVRNRREVSAKKGNTSAKSKRVRINNTGKASRKSPGKTVCAAASKGKAKGKAVPKG